MGKEEGVDLSPAVLEAEESADGRVRVPKIKRKGMEPKGRSRKGEERRTPKPDIPLVPVNSNPELETGGPAGYAYFSNVRRT